MEANTSTKEFVTKYRIQDALFFHKRKNYWLVVSRTPPAWTIVNQLGYEIISVLPRERSFDIFDVVNLLTNQISLDDLRLFLEQLSSKLIIIREDALRVSQTDRELAINGLYIEITPQCNLHCKHCYVESKITPPDLMLTREQILNTIFQLTPPAEIGFSGGEPLLRNDCMSMIREVSSKGYSCTLLTNGLLITDELAKELSELKVTVQVSLEGASPAVNDQIRGKGSFDAIIKSIDRLVQNKVDVRVSFTPTAINHHDFNGLLNLIKKMGVRSLHVCTFTPQGRGKKNADQLMLNNDDLYEFQTLVYKAAKDFDIMGNLPETLDLSRVGYLWDKCPLGGSMHVGHDGSIYPCEIAATKKMIIGNINDTTLDEALKSDAANLFINNSRNRIDLLHECINCEWKHFCGGGCLVLALAKKGELNVPDYLCNCRKKWFEELLWDKLSQS